MCDINIYKENVLKGENFSNVTQIPRPPFHWSGWERSLRISILTRSPGSATHLGEHCRTRPLGGQNCRREGKGRLEDTGGRARELVGREQEKGAKEGFSV